MWLSIYSLWFSVVNNLHGPCELQFRKELCCVCPALTCICLSMNRLHLSLWVDGFAVKGDQNSIPLKKCFGQNKNFQGSGLQWYKRKSHYKLPYLSEYSAYNGPDSSSFILMTNVLKHWNQMQVEGRGKVLATTEYHQNFVTFLDASIWHVPWNSSKPKVLTYSWSKNNPVLFICLIGLEWVLGSINILCHFFNMY